MMNRAEQKLVLELCRCQNPNTKQIENLKKQGVDEAVVLGQLLFHRVAGTAYMTWGNVSFVFFGLLKTNLVDKTTKICYHRSRKNFDVCKISPKMSSV